MALNKSQLKTEIKSLLNDLKTNTDQEDSIDTYADRLSNIIDNYIKTAVVDVIGQSVSGGAVTGTGTIS